METFFLLIAAALVVVLAKLDAERLISSSAVLQLDAAHDNVTRLNALISERDTTIQTQAGDIRKIGEINAKLSTDLAAEKDYNTRLAAQVGELESFINAVPAAPVAAKTPRKPRVSKVAAVQ